MRKTRGRAIDWEHFLMGLIWGVYIGFGTMTITKNKKVSVVQIVGQTLINLVIVEDEEDSYKYTNNLNVN